MDTSYYCFLLSLGVTKEGPLRFMAVWLKLSPNAVVFLLAGADVWGAKRLGRMMMVFLSAPLVLEHEGWYRPDLLRLFVESGSVLM